MFSFLRPGGFETELLLSREHVYSAAATTATALQWYLIYNLMGLSNEPTMAPNTCEQFAGLRRYANFGRVWD